MSRPRTVGHVLNLLWGDVDSFNGYVKMLSILFPNFRLMKYLKRPRRVLAKMRAMKQGDSLDGVFTRTAYPSYRYFTIFYGVLIEVSTLNMLNSFYIYSPTNLSGVWQ